MYICIYIYMYICVTNTLECLWAIVAGVPQFCIYLQIPTSTQPYFSTFTHKYSSRRGQWRGCSCYIRIYIYKHTHAYKYLLHLHINTRIVTGNGGGAAVIYKTHRREKSKALCERVKSHLRESTSDKRFLSHPSETTATSE